MISSQIMFWTSLTRIQNLVEDMVADHKVSYSPTHFLLPFGDNETNVKI
jgi:hypothetical protein